VSAEPTELPMEGFKEKAPVTGENATGARPPKRPHGASAVTVEASAAPTSPSARVSALALGEVAVAAPALRRPEG